MLAERIAARLGLRPELCGSTYIVDAATLFAYADMPMPDIYATVAAYRGITPSGVHKNAAYAVARSYRLAYGISITFDVPLESHELSPNTVVAYLAKAIKHPELFDMLEHTSVIYDKESD